MVLTRSGAKRRLSFPSTWGSTRKRSNRFVRPAGWNRVWGRKWAARSRRPTDVVTSRDLSASDAQKYRGKLISRPNYRSLLWDTTLMKQHYRSVYNVSNTDFVTPNVHGQVNVSGFLALNPLNTAATAFWLGGAGGGGLRPVNYNVAGTVPTLAPNSVVIRGGIIKFSAASNPTAINTCQVMIFLAYSKGQMKSALGTVPAAGSGSLNEWLANLGTLSPYPSSWDPTDEADYSEYFHPPIVKKMMDLKPGDNFDVVHRLKTTKIDADNYLRYGAGMPHWIVTYGQVNNSNGATEVIESTAGYNLSFSVVDL